MPEKRRRVERQYLLHLRCGSGSVRGSGSGSGSGRGPVPWCCQCHDMHHCHEDGYVYDVQHVHASPRCAFRRFLLPQTPSHSHRVRMSRPVLVLRRGRGSSPACARSIAFPRNLGGAWGARPTWRRNRWRETWTTGTLAGTGGEVPWWRRRACARIRWREWRRRRRPWQRRRGCRRCGGSGGVFRWAGWRSRPCRRGEWKRWRRTWEPMRLSHLGIAPTPRLRNLSSSSIPEGSGRRTTKLLIGKKHRLKSLENK